jgi:hypothetical protein
MTAKALALSLNPPTCPIQLNVTTFSLRDVIVQRRVPPSSFVKVFTEALVIIASLKSKDEVMEDDARSDENDGPFVVL